MSDAALSADSDRSRCTAGSERVPEENAGRRPTLERPRNLEEEKERLEEERRQRAVSYVDAAAETRAEALWRKRRRWWRHADASTADKSFKRKYRMDLSAFNKLVGILRPIIERDETFARELSYVPLGIILKKCYIPVVKPGREVDHSST